MPQDREKGDYGLLKTSVGPVGGGLGHRTAVVLQMDGD